MAKEVKAPAPEQTAESVPGKEAPAAADDRKAEPEKEMTSGEKIENMYYKIIEFYGNFDSRMNDVIDRINKYADYTKILDSEQSKKKSEMECLALQKALVEERSMLGLKLDDMHKTFKDEFKVFENMMQQMQKNITDLNDLIDEKLKDFKTIDAKIVDTLGKFREDMTSASNNEYNILQTKCGKTIEDNKTKIELVSNSVISFLKKCEEQNKNLISKVPEQKRKRDWKDFVIYALSFLCVVSMSFIVFRTVTGKF